VAVGSTILSFCKALAIQLQALAILARATPLIFGDETASRRIDFTHYIWQVAIGVEWRVKPALVVLLSKAYASLVEGCQSWICTLIHGLVHLAWRLDHHLEFVLVIQVGHGLIGWLCMLVL